MNEIIEAITKKTGISDSQARTATETVLGFLKKKLPAPIAQQVESAITGGGGGLGKGLGGLGGMLGGEQHK